MKYSECCMCGDYGYSSELFRCTICQFRSQHRYCSNLYPKAESYQICNWCLSTTKEKIQKSSISSSSSRNTSEDDPKIAKRLRGTKLQDIQKRGITKRVIRNRMIRKYKRLDEVCS
ncbi:uncharacterized protein LOC132602509 [Lycium barbarum]|uniref:uncharacterized protein LOC132602509 n=1 Tax=Lycium barbarum TaxID=112863 RepID=UPI00293F0702|nr:uncharacterized protein LOC132602509 [Lycium barbarum]